MEQEIQEKLEAEARVYTGKLAEILGNDPNIEVVEQYLNLACELAYTAYQKGGEKMYNELKHQIIDRKVAAMIVRKYWGNQALGEIVWEAILYEADPDKAIKKKIKELG